MAESGEPLSERELDVLRCLASGASNKAIAADLTISENTVKVHLRNIYTKLEVSSRTEATTAGIQKGYIAVPGQEEQPDLVDDRSTNGQETVSPASDQISTVPGESAELDSPSTGATHRRARRIMLLAVLLLSAMAVALFLSQQLLNQNTEPTAEIPFEETAIGDSRWLKSRPMPEARANMAVASIGLDLYQMGGDTAAGVDGKTLAFNSLNREWRTVAEKPTGVADASAAELYGELYVVGGRLQNGRPTSTVEAYSPTQDAWRPVAPLPHPISGGLTLSDGSFLYLFGGHDGESFLDSSYVYDPSTDSWRPLPPIPQARASASGADLTGKLIVVGGHNNSGELGTCFQFDQIEEIWSECPKMLSPRTSAGSAVLLNKLYVIGGTNEEDEISFSEMYDPAGETWQVINTPMLVDTADWPGLGVGQIETRIYALGGRSSEQYLDTNYAFAPLVYQTYIPAASSAEDE